LLAHKNYRLQTIALIYTREYLIIFTGGFDLLSSAIAENKNAFVGLQTQKTITTQTKSQPRQALQVQPLIPNVSFTDQNSCQLLKTFS